MIRTVTARAILDSRGNPTVETTVTTDKVTGTASVPSGVSTGTHEAKELRDGDRRWGGRGVSKAVSHVNVEIAGLLKGKDVTDQEAIDTSMIELDGTTDKSRLGANAILSVSLACLDASAKVHGVAVWQHLANRLKRSEPAQLPIPLCNVINGGAHADNALNIQEFMLAPHGFDTFSEATRALSETFHALRKLLQTRNLSTGVGDEGGFAPPIESHTAVLDLLVSAITAAGYKPGTQISLALDVAASEFMQDGSYIFENQGLSASQLVALYDSLVAQYPIVSIEDPLGEDDFEGWELLHNRLADKVQIVGDDLTVTNVSRINQAIEKRLVSAVILKPNQIGTVTETVAAHLSLKEQSVHSIPSHRSGETNDPIIADIAVGLEASQMKLGSVSRGERISKYNRLLAIEQYLGGSAVYPNNIYKKKGTYA